MYLWRKLNEKQREDALKYRSLQRFPKHSPPHFDSECSVQYIITSACYEHKNIIGNSIQRMAACEASILEIC